MSISDFTISADPSANRGYDATNAEVLTLQLENLPATDVYRTQFFVTQFSKDMPALVFSPVSGEPATPGGSVTLTCPASDTHSFIIDCVVNNGVDQSGVTRADYRSARLVAVRNVNGLGKIVPGETTQYDVTNGWTGRVNEMVDAVDALATATVDPTPGTILVRGPSGEGKCTSFEASSGGEYRFNIASTLVTGMTMDGSKNLIVGESVDVESIQLLAGVNKNISTLVTGTATDLHAAVGATSIFAVNTNGVEVLKATAGVLSLSAGASLKVRNDADTAYIDAITKDSGDILRIGENTDALGLRLSVSSGGFTDFDFNGTAALRITATGAAFQASGASNITAPAALTLSADTGASGSTLIFRVSNAERLRLKTTGFEIEKATTFSVTQPQSTSGAGRNWSVTGQRGEAGTNGASLVFAVGDAGTAGSNMQGEYVTALGSSGDLTGVARWTGGAFGTLLTVSYDDTIGETLLSSPTHALTMQSATAASISATAGNLALSVGGSNSITLSAGGAGIEVQQNAGVKIGVFGTTPAAQQADIGALTDNSGGTANNTIEALPDPADAPLTADALRDDLVANLIPALRNDIADLAEQCNALRAVVRAYGWMA